MELRWPLFRNLFQLTLALCLSFGQLTAVRAAENDSVGANQGETFAPTELATENIDSYSRLIELAEGIARHKVIYAYLNEQLRPFRKIPTGLQQKYGWPAESKGLSTTQLMFLFQKYPDEWPWLEKYLKTVTPENLKDPEIVDFRNKLKTRFADILADKETLMTFIQMNSPSEPLRLFLPGSKPAISNMKIFVDHPSLKDPSNPAAGLIPADNLKKVIVDTINTAKKSIHVNVFEFNLMEIADALIAQNEKGLSVNIGIDKKTIDLSPENKAVWDKLTAQTKKNKNFHLTGVDSVGLNHQKIVIIDAGEKVARTIFSSGNFTQSCIGPEGDLKDLPAGTRSTKSIPNANHLILVEGALPALVTKFELQKTLVDGLRGQEYPISGSYVFNGPVDPKTKKPTEMVVGFSPNGGMGEVNRDLTKRLILSSKKGEILAMHFAFSSKELIDALTQKIISARTDHSGFRFRSVGDPPFAVQFWSGFLALSGLKFDDATQKYGIDPESPLVKSLSKEELKTLQTQIRIDPNTFGNFNEKMPDGRSAKVSVKLHHKVFINPTEGWAVIGTSFNPSGSAENNQEQWVLVKNTELVGRIHGAFEYLYQKSGTSKSPGNVARYASLRNLRKLGEIGDIGGAEADEIKRQNSKSKEKPSAYKKVQDLNRDLGATLCRGIF